jgi:hypothetical protein
VPKVRTEIGPVFPVSPPPRAFTQDKSVPMSMNQRMRNCKIQEKGMKKHGIR